MSGSLNTLFNGDIPDSIYSTTPNALGTPYGYAGVTAAGGTPPTVAPTTTPAGAAPAAAAPTQPMSVTDALQQWANKQNQNLYGFDPTAAGGQQHLGILGSAGFPQFGDPRTTMDYLAQLSQGTVTNPNITPQQALAQFQQMLQAQNNPSYGGYGGGYGGGGQGPDIGGGPTG